MLIDFDEWVNEHGPPSASESGEAGPFWGYIEVVRRLAEKFDVQKANVAGTYAISAPSTGEKLTLPVAVLDLPHAELALRWDPGAWPNEWTVSVERDAPFRGSLLGLFDPGRDLRAAPPAGLDRETVFPPFAESPARFTCELNDEWDVATLARLVAWEE